MFLLLLSSIMFSTSILGQSTYSDEKIHLSSEVKELADKKNDIFYSYYEFSIENKTNETIKVEVDIIYSDGTATRKKSEGDEGLILELAPNETIKGDIKDFYGLTLFKNHNVGNTGKKASDVEYELKEIKVKYL